MKRLAQIISIIFHPVLMPLIGFLIIFNSGVFPFQIPKEFIRNIYIMVAILSIFIPISITALLIYWRYIKDFRINERKERNIPLFFTCALFLALHITLNKLHLPIISAYTFSGTLSAIILLLINRWYKISVHMLALGANTAFVIILSLLFQVQLFNLLLVFFLVSGFVASSRIYLKAHAVLEVFFGYLIGFIFTFCIIFLKMNGAKFFIG